MASRGFIAGVSVDTLFLFSSEAIRRPLSRQSCRVVQHYPLLTASYSTRLSPNAPDLIKWIRDERGFVHQGLRLDNEGSSGLGLLSSRVITKGTEIISLPHHIPLALPPLDSGSDHPDAVLIDLARRLPERVAEELWTLRLGLKLLGERAKVGSFWWPYISNLPQAFNVPIFFSREEIGNLQYIPLIHQVNKRCKLLLSFEADVKSVTENLGSEQHPFGGQHVDAAALGWAMSAVSTRAFRLHAHITSDGKRGSTPMLLPLIDMCNHDFHANAQIVQEAGSGSDGTLVKIDCVIIAVTVSTRAFRLHAHIMSDGKRGSTPMLLPLIDMCNHDFHANAQIVQEAGSDSDGTLVKVVAEEKIEEDKPILLNYGSLTNDLLLLDYGFIVPGNQHDYVELKYDELLLDAAAITAGVQCTAFASPAPWQRKLLSQLYFHGDKANYKVTLGGPEIVDGRLVAALRILFAEDSESIQKYGLNALHSLTVEAPLGVANESNVLRTIVALCVIALGHFPTQITEDKTILKKEGNSEALKLAIEFRLSKKELLIKVMKALTKKVKNLR